MWHYVPAETARPNLRHHETEHHPRQRVGYPTQLFCRRLIDQAFHDALQKRAGLPTENALDAASWIAAKTDWTLCKNRIPPAEIRTEFYGTFEWACRCLGENPERVRVDGLVLAHGRCSSQGRETWRRNRTGGTQV
jgi:hypothetical protein